MDFLNKCVKVGIFTNIRHYVRCPIFRHCPRLGTSGFSGGGGVAVPPPPNGRGPMLLYATNPKFSKFLLGPFASDSCKMAFTSTVNTSLNVLPLTLPKYIRQGTRLPSTRSMIFYPLSFYPHWQSLHIPKVKYLPLLGTSTVVIHVTQPKFEKALFTCVVFIFYALLRNISEIKTVIHCLKTVTDKTRISHCLSKCKYYF